MRRKIALGLFAGMASMTLPLAQAQSPSDSKDALQKKLQDQYAVTKLTADHAQVVTTGAVLVLKKDGLVMASSATNDVAGNTYKGGKITQNAVGKTNEKMKKIGGFLHKVPGVPGAPTAPTAPTIDTRQFVAGEKVYVTKIDAKANNTVAFELYSVEAYSDLYYHATLTFLVDKDATVSAADAAGAVAEVFKVAEDNSASSNQKTSHSGVGNASQNAPARAPASTPSTDAPIAADAPPPPPPADTKPIGIGASKEEVVAGFGQPDSIAKQAGKEIYIYKKMNLKVTFVNGKVSDIE